MDTGKVLRWLKSEGDTVAKGDDLYEVETEKVNMEVEAPADGTLLKIVVDGGGDEVPIGTVLAYLGEPGEAVPDAPAAAPASNGSAPAATPTPPPAAAPKPAKAPAASAPAPAAAQAPAPAATLAPVGAAPTTSRIKASPLARKMARDKGLDLSQLAGSGPEGRIVARDLEGAELQPAAATSVTSGDVERVPLTSMRRTIVRRLGEAWQAPAFYLTREIDMEQANDLRQRLVDAMHEGDTKPTVSDIITKACAVALRRHREMNSHFAGDEILRFGSVHIGMAVATDNGLVVPVIRDCHLKTVREIAADRSALVKKARSGKLSPADMEGGTFTVSNLGMMGIDHFTAVLNPPMAGILAVGQTQDTVVAVKGKPTVRPRMTVTLGCDHRAVDGAIGAAFLQTLAGNLEDPLTML
jgi:pyruvate dehydrogenase E2 component (dihydrolipoamide acetyltransferase)